MDDEKGPEEEAEGEGDGEDNADGGPGYGQDGAETPSVVGVVW